METWSAKNHIASVSFGKDSLAMLLYLLENNYPLDEIVFYDTGMEFQAIYGLRDSILPLLAKHGVTYTELHPREPFLYTMLEKPCKSEEKGKHLGYGWCGGMCRWGTTGKQLALDKYAEERQAIVYVGIAADEPKRLRKIRKQYKRYPLAKKSVQMTEHDCLQYCYDRGYSWNENGVELYSILDRVSCWCCCNKNRKELKNIYRYLPFYWEKLKFLQSKLDRPMKRFQTKAHGEYGNVFTMEKIFKEEIENELYALRQTR